jgi:hypothetical protein
VSDPADPKLTGQLWLGGVLGRPDDAGRGLNGKPNMLPGLPTPTSLHRARSHRERPPLNRARTPAHARQ